MLFRKTKAFMMSRYVFRSDLPLHRSRRDTYLLYIRNMHMFHDIRLHHAFHLPGSTKILSIARCGKRT